ncbi:MAG: cupredoxin domain-containing protein [Pseudobdellovibrionaceae bacterium]
MRVLLATLALLSCSSFAKEGDPQVIEVKVTESGFEPSTIDVKSGASVKLKVTRTTDATCATEIKVKNVQKKLPLNEPVIIDLGKIKKGSLGFSCGMDMLKGEIIVK